MTVAEFNFAYRNTAGTTSQPRKTGVADALFLCGSWAPVRSSHFGTYIVSNKYTAYIMRKLFLNKVLKTSAHISTDARRRLFPKLRWTCFLRDPEKNPMAVKIITVIAILTKVRSDVVLLAAKTGPFGQTTV